MRGLMTLLSQAQKQSELIQIAGDKRERDSALHNFRSEVDKRIDRLVECNAKEIEVSYAFFEAGERIYLNAEIDFYVPPVPRSLRPEDV